MLLMLMFARFDQSWSPCCTRLISKTLVTALLLSTVAPTTTAFTQHSTCRRALHHTPRSSSTNTLTNNNPELTQQQRTDRSTQLNVWWFGGTDNSARTEDDELCELIAVRIERPTSNSRQIAGTISIP